jgi:predicted permease
MKDSDKSSKETLKRAKSYFLIASMVGNALTFAVGPKLLDDEESPDAEGDKEGRTEEEETDEDGLTEAEREEYENPRNEDGRTAHDEEAAITEETSLLPSRLERPASKVASKISGAASKLWQSLPQFLRKVLSTIWSFFNAPLWGALIGGFIGLIPPLQKAFFADPEEGGIFKTWLTQSIENIGDLFASLQLVVVGAKLANAITKAKLGRASGNVPLPTLLTIFAIRFFIWPAISISTIYFIATRTGWLDKDPVLWFVLMLMPTGPPATKLTALADVSGEDEKQKMAISKFLAMSYAVSPIVALTVVGSLKACSAISEQM